MTTVEIGGNSGDGSGGSGANQSRSTAASTATLPCSSPSSSPRTSPRTNDVPPSTPSIDTVRARLETLRKKSSLLRTPKKSKESSTNGEKEMISVMMTPRVSDEKNHMTNIPSSPDTLPVPSSPHTTPSAAAAASSISPPRPSPNTMLRRLDHRSDPDSVNTLSLSTIQSLHDRLRSQILNEMKIELQHPEEEFGELVKRGFRELEMQQQQQKRRKEKKQSQNQQHRQEEEKTQPDEERQHQHRHHHSHNNSFSTSNSKRNMLTIQVDSHSPRPEPLDTPASPLTVNVAASPLQSPVMLLASPTSNLKTPKQSPSSSSSQQQQFKPRHLHVNIAASPQTKTGKEQLEESGTSRLLNSPLSPTTILLSPTSSRNRQQHSPGSSNQNEISSPRSPVAILLSARAAARQTKDWKEEMEKRVEHPNVRAAIDCVATEGNSGNGLTSPPRVRSPHDGSTSAIASTAAASISTSTSSSSPAFKRALFHQRTDSVSSASSTDTSIGALTSSTSHTSNNSLQPSRAASKSRAHSRQESFDGEDHGEVMMRVSTAGMVTTATSVAPATPSNATLTVAHHASTSHHTRTRSGSAGTNAPSALHRSPQQRSQLPPKSPRSSIFMTNGPGSPLAPASVGSSQNLLSAASPRATNTSAASAGIPTPPRRRSFRMTSSPSVIMNGGGGGGGDSSPVVTNNYMLSSPPPIHPSSPLVSYSPGQPQPQLMYAYPVNSDGSTTSASPRGGAYFYAIPAAAMTPQSPYYQQHLALPLSNSATTSTNNSGTAFDFTLPPIANGSSSVLSSSNSLFGPSPRSSVSSSVSSSLNGRPTHLLTRPVSLPTHTQPPSSPSLISSTSSTTTSTSASASRQTRSPQPPMMRPHSESIATKRRDSTNSTLGDSQQYRSHTADTLLHPLLLPNASSTSTTGSSTSSTAGSQVGSRSATPTSAARMKRIRASSMGTSLPHNIGVNQQQDGAMNTESQLYHHHSQYQQQPYLSSQYSPLVLVPASPSAPSALQVGNWTQQLNELSPQLGPYSPVMMPQQQQQLTSSNEQSVNAASSTHRTLQSTTRGSPVSTSQKKKPSSASPVVQTTKMASTQLAGSSSNKKRENATLKTIISFATATTDVKSSSSSSKKKKKKQTASPVAKMRSKIASVVTSPPPSSASSLIKPQLHLDLPSPMSRPEPSASSHVPAGVIAPSSSGAGWSADMLAIAEGDESALSTARLGGKSGSNSATQTIRSGIGSGAGNSVVTSPQAGPAGRVLSLNLAPILLSSPPSSSTTTIEIEEEPDLAGLEHDLIPYPPDDTDQIMSGLRSPTSAGSALSPPGLMGDEESQYERYQDQEIEEEEGI